MESAGPSTASTPSATPSRGRPRDPERDRAICEAALELLASEGYDRLTMELVATRAGAGKATLYRRWNSKAELVIDALALIKPPLDPLGTGSLEGDLAALVDAACSRKSAFATTVMCGVVSALGRDPELLAAFRESFTERRIARIRIALEEADARGELPAGLDIPLAASIVPSLILQRALLTGQPAERSYIEHLIGQVLRPMLGLPPLPTATTTEHP